VINLSLPGVSIYLCQHWLKG